MWALQKSIIILYIESAKTVNEMTLHELVKLMMLWTTGPWRTFCQWSSTLSMLWANSSGHWLMIFFLFSRKNLIENLMLKYGIESQISDAHKILPILLFLQDILKITFWDCKAFGRNLKTTFNTWQNTTKFRMIYFPSRHILFIIKIINYVPQPCEGDILFLVRILSASA